MNSYPRESDEFQAVTVTVDDIDVTDGVTLAVTRGDHRPTGWTDLVTLSGKIGVMTGGRTPGTYRVWAKITASPEIPVLDCGAFAIT